MLYCSQGYTHGTLMENCRVEELRVPCETYESIGEMCTHLEDGTVFGCIAVILQVEFRLRVFRRWQSRLKK